MIELRVAESDEDLEAWRQVRMAVLPDERALTVEEMRAMHDEERTYLVAFLDGRLAGSGLGGRSSFGYAGLHPRVLPEARRHGVGTAILRALADRAVAQGFTEAGTNVEEPGALAFAERFGYEEVDRQVEQVLTLAGDEPWPHIPDGISIVSVAERPELWAQAYDPLALEAFADMATFRPVVVSREQWERDWLDWPEGMFLALAGEEIVGYAGLERDDDHPERAEHAMTAVRRTWRRRGLATVLKQHALAFGAANGVRQVYTWTQRDNADMRALNERLGFTRRSESITVRAALPLPAPD